MAGRALSFRVRRERPPPNFCTWLTTCGRISSTRSFMYSRSSAMSCTRAWLPPRSRRAASMNCAKLSSRSRATRGPTLLSSSSSSSYSVQMLDTTSKLLSSKRMSFMAMKSSASTPRFPRIMCISGFCMSSSNSSLRSVPLLLMSWTSRMGSKCCLNVAMAAPSFSFFVTSVTTSQIMPTNMFNNVKFVKNTKNMNTVVKNGDSGIITSTWSLMPSSNVPCKNRNIIEVPTDENTGCSAGISSACILKTIAKI
mmetsp:Transcript_30884/g.89933  ORF Transcript_30884/g.89933 Transcript_30884/m.89933 type:complete len:253 (+) Transcript_30884:403-1161(+)